MRYSPPPADLFARNRAKFLAEMAPNTAAIFWSNDPLPTNVDHQYTLQQNSNFYYLTGIHQEGCVLVLLKNPPRPRFGQMLFILRSSEHLYKWEGWKYSPDEARAASGVEQVLYADQLEGQLLHLISQVDGFYIDTNEHDRNRLFVQTAAHRFAERMQREFPAHKLHRAAPLLARLRETKEPEELAQMQRAIDITEKAFRRVLGFVKPGVMEYEIEAEIVHEFLRNGATRAAYDSIIAGGANACVLHYVLNNQPVKDGDLVLMDFGCEYGMYDSDLTRTIPVNGRYSPRQRAVYDAVLRAHRFAAGLLKPGVLLDEYSRQVGEYMSEELVKLGLLKPEEARSTAPTEDAKPYWRYFYHGTSHFLGLDTHDVGNRYAPIRAGMVFTVEPGLYIQEEGIGIRIENNYLITDSGVVDLMANIPIEAEEIEQLMQAGC